MILYDYIVDSRWHGREGTVFYRHPLGPKKGGQPFKVFSSIRAAINDGATGQTMFIAPGLYEE